MAENGPSLPPSLPPSPSLPNFSRISKVAAVLQFCGAAIFAFRCAIVVCFAAGYNTSAFSYADFETQCRAGYIIANICELVNVQILSACAWPLHGAPSSPQQCSEYWSRVLSQRALDFVAGINASTCLSCIVLGTVSLCGMFGVSRASKAMVLISAVCNALIVLSTFDAGVMICVIISCAILLSPLLSLIAAVQWLKLQSSQQTSSSDDQDNAYQRL
eukprot:TRINITY_DN18130_c0_g1_i1.p1 TRINITY_DN18130_c0_g1~~TRINITY_DN18130_c0_g1_i1.p1  ORF type:complete len:238 (-),score=23.78 TRINITY_DN18130_c0_g1_i1:216-866(-)